jgi:hypothetical protein
MHVTGVNGVWQGPKKGEIPTHEELEACPQIWDFLNEKGEQGWELVSATSTHKVFDNVDSYYTELFLKRRLP